eukprot:503780_1
MCVGVLWDYQKNEFKKKADEYLKLHPDGDDEFYQNDIDEKDINENDSKQSLSDKFKKFNDNPHQVRRKRKKYKLKQIKDEDKKPDIFSNEDYLSDSDEHSSEWDEPDFEEILSKPLSKYRWGLNDPNSEFGIALDLEITESNNIKEEKYLMIDDRVIKSTDFKGRQKKRESKHGIVLRVEQLDGRRVNVNKIKGDKIYTTWCSYQSYIFQSDNDMDDIVFYKRGQLFKDKWNRIKIGDRVKRGITW